MSTGDDGPRYHPPASPGQYAQYPQNPYGPNAANDPYPYTPYSAAPQPPVAPEPVRRPGTVVGAVVALVLGALPFVVLGAISLFVPISEEQLRAQLPPEINLDEMLTQANVQFSQLLEAIRLFLAIGTIVGLAYILLALTVLRGRRWARTVVTVLAVLFAVFLVLNLSASVVGLLFAVPLVLTVVGIVLLYRRPTTEWFGRL